MKDTGERLIPKLHKKSLAYGEHLSRYEAVCELTKGKIVLDIACGAGYGTELIAKKAKKVIGIDLYPEVIAYAKNNYAQANIDFKQGDALAIPLKDKSVEVVVSLETIEHLPNPELFVKEVKRVLKLGGLFVVSTPNDEEYVEGNEFHVHEFDFKELDRLIKKYFINHDYYYQGSWFVAGLLNKKLFENSFITTGIRVIKSFEQKFNKAIYYIAVASDAKLSKLEQNLVVSDVFSPRANQQNHLAVVDQINSLNKAVDNYRLRTEEVTRKRDELDIELQGIHQSKGWRLLKRTYQVRDTFLKPIKKHKNK